MGEIIENDLKGWAYASKRKVARVESLSSICCHVKKHKDTIRKFEIMKSIHVESLKALLKP